MEKELIPQKEFSILYGSKFKMMNQSIPYFNPIRTESRKGITGKIWLYFLVEIDFNFDYSVLNFMDKQHRKIVSNFFTGYNVFIFKIKEVTDIHIDSGSPDTHRFFEMRICAIVEIYK